MTSKSLGTYPLRCECFHLEILVYLITGCVGDDASDLAGDLMSHVVYVLYCFSKHWDSKHPAPKISGLKRIRYQTDPELSAFCPICLIITTMII